MRGRHNEQANESHTNVECLAKAVELEDWRRNLGWTASILAAWSAASFAPPCSIIPPAADVATKDLFDT